MGRSGGEEGGRLVSSEVSTLASGRSVGLSGDLLAVAGPGLFATVEPNFGTREPPA